MRNFVTNTRNHEIPYKHLRNMLIIFYNLLKKKWQYYYLETTIIDENRNFELNYKKCYKY